MLQNDINENNFEKKTMMIFIEHIIDNLVALFLARSLSLSRSFSLLI